MATKKEIFEQTLTSAYDSQKYVDFIREMITGVVLCQYFGHSFCVNPSMLAAA